MKNINKEIPASIHPSQWEVINGEARPKNPHQLDGRAENGTFFGLNDWEHNDFDKFAKQHTYPTLGIPNGTHESSELVFKAQWRIHEQEWQDEEMEYLESFDSIQDYLDTHNKAKYKTGIETRQMIAIAETQATPPALSTTDTMSEEIIITDSERDPVKVNFDYEDNTTTIVQYGFVLNLSEHQAVKLANLIMNNYYAR